MDNFAVKTAGADPFRPYRYRSHHFAIASIMRMMGRPPTRVFSDVTFYNRAVLPTSATATAVQS